MSQRIYMSPPHMTDLERNLLLEAFDSNWIAPVGPDLPAFEDDIARWTGRSHAVALSSGTAGLHLSMLLVGVQPGDEVLVPSFTFVATANAVLQAGGVPIFVDSEAASWNIDPDLVAEALKDRARAGRLPSAVVAVDLYGQCADYARLEPLCAEYDVPLVVDAAEALGARRDGRPAGSQGSLAVVSFNGNKIITTGGGGAVVTDDEAVADRVRHLATQAREPAAHYAHIDAGFNYRMSNLLAALGRGQLQRLPEMMARRAEIGATYRAVLSDCPGVAFMPTPAGSHPNGWLTVITIDPTVAGTDREALRLALEEHDIEARPAWKPMHLQPLFADAGMVGGGVSDQVFATGLCLPSGSSLGNDDLERVLAVLADALCP